MQQDDTIQQILERNARVEQYKTWETSKTRRGFLMLTTYITALIFLWIIDEHLFYLKALVPAAGYLLSTLTLPSLKSWWIKRFSKR